MLKNILVSEVRIKILSLLLLNPAKSFHVRAIVRAVGAEINAIRRELENLSSIGLLTYRQSSNRLYYTVNITHPFYTDLVSLCAKEDGFGGILVKRSKELGSVDFIVLSKAFIKGRNSTALDVDLFVVGSVNNNILETVIKAEEERLGKEINYTVMPLEEFQYRKRTNDQFVQRVLSQSRIMIYGDEERFCSLV